MEKNELVVDLMKIAESGAPSGTAVLDRRRALVADDESAIARLVRMTLERMGFEVEVVGDGAKALDVIEARLPDLLVLDVMMPFVDGFDVLRRVRREHGERVRIIMLTAKTGDGDVFRGYRNGADAYLTKPFNPSELAVFVRRIMS
jgi:two-component system alkaline phosphatase synthesis response regulator PhoP/two-component system response regulator VicR